MEDVVEGVGWVAIGVVGACMGADVGVGVCVCVKGEWMKRRGRCALCIGSNAVGSA